MSDEYIKSFFNLFIKIGSIKIFDFNTIPFLFIKSNDLINKN